MADLDPNLVAQVKGFEGYNPDPYWDYKQSTSGYGTKAQRGDENIPPDQLKAVHEQRLQSELSSAQDQVDSVNPNLPPGARAALTSLTFNAGGGWAHEGLGDLVRNNDLAGARNKLLQYNKAGGEVNDGLVARRAKEASWFDGTVPETDGPTAIQTAMGGSRSQPRSTSMLGYAPENNPNGALSSAPPPGALSAAGGAAPQQSWLQTLGQTLQDVAPGIAQDPENKKALLAMAAAGKPVQGTWSTNFDPRTGIATQTNSLNPQLTRQFKYADPKPDDKWGIIGTDKWGKAQYGYVPSPEEYAAKKTEAPAEASPGSDLTGKDYLTYLQNTDPTHAAHVQAVIEGRMPFPTGRLRTTPDGSRIADDVVQADPSFETGNAASRIKVRNEFMAGGPSSPAGQITAGNTAIKHAGEMSDALEVLKGPNGENDHSSLPYLSYYLNKNHNASIQGTPAGAALGDFLTARDHFAEEVTKFYSGTGGSEAERQRALDNLDAAKSLPELRSVINKEAGLMQGKVNSLQERWRTGMGPLVSDYELIHPESQKALDRIQQRATASSPTGTATTPQLPKGVKSIQLIQ